LIENDLDFSCRPAPSTDPELTFYSTTAISLSSVSSAISACRIRRDDSSPFCRASGTASSSIAPSEDLRIARSIYKPSSLRCGRSDWWRPRRPIGCRPRSDASPSACSAFAGGGCRYLAWELTYGCPCSPQSSST